MMLSGLYTGLKQNNPITKTDIPSCGSPNGMPFCMKYSGDVTQWQIVKEGDETGYDLDVSWLVNDGTYIYYNAKQNIIEYLAAQGHDISGGRYYYLFRLDGYETPSNIIGLDGNNGLYYPSTKMYGVWEIEVDISTPDWCTFAFITDGTNPNLNSYQIYTSGSFFEFYSYTVGVVSHIFEVNDIGVTIEKITIKRNETINQFFTGAADSFAFYINDILIDDSAASTGTNPIVDTNPSITSSVDSLFITGEDGVLFNPPLPYNIWAGAWLFSPSDITGGTIKQSNIFQLECEDLIPVTPGDFNNDFNNDFF